MRADAFDNVKCPFNYKKELMGARRALDEKVAKYISKNRAKSYRFGSGVPPVSWHPKQDRKGSPA